MSLFDRWTKEGRVEAKRASLAGRARTAGAETLATYLSTPLPGRDTEARELPALAVDMETTGLEPGRDRLLSVGFVAVNGLEIDLSTAQHLLIRQDENASDGVGQSATVHGITDDALTSGVELRDAIEALLEALTGRVMLCHFDRIETGFLDAACTRLYGVGAPTTTIDTLELHRRLLTGGGEQVVPVGALRLDAARSSLGLPRYGAHEALTDALACAELYLALVAHLAGDSPMPLRRLT